MGGRTGALRLHSPGQGLRPPLSSQCLAGLAGKLKPCRPILPHSSPSCDLLVGLPLVFSTLLIWRAWHCVCSHTATSTCVLTCVRGRQGCASHTWARHARMHAPIVACPKWPGSVLSADCSADGSASESCGFQRTRLSLSLSPSAFFVSVARFRTLGQQHHH